MSLHIRHVSHVGSPRVQVKYRRDDLLYKTAEPLVSPDGKIKINGLPIYPGKSKTIIAVGPTLADMLTRKPLKIAGKVEVVWQLRDLKTIWPAPKSKKKAAKADEVIEPEKQVDHPFQHALASGGVVTDEDACFVRVEKYTTLSIAEHAFKLAVGMKGGISEAYSYISNIADKAWNADLVRARQLFDLIQEADGFLIEDGHVNQLRPASSVSREVEADIMRQCCAWLGVPADMDIRRGRGKPSQAAPGDEGEFIQINYDQQNRASATMKKRYHGIDVGVDLADVGLPMLIELLGHLRLDKFDIDANLLEAWMDVADPDWRDHVGDQEGLEGGAHTNPYEVLDVQPDASIDDVRKAYKWAMQKVHPDTSGLSRVFSQMVADAYRTIREERGES